MQTSEGELSAEVDRDQQEIAFTSERLMAEFGDKPFFYPPMPKGTVEYRPER